MLNNQFETSAMVWYVTGVLKEISTIHTHIRFTAIDTPSVGGCPRVGLHLQIVRVLIVKPAPAPSAEDIHDVNSISAKEDLHWLMMIRVLIAEPTPVPSVVILESHSYYISEECACVRGLLMVYWCCVNISQRGLRHGCARALIAQLVPVPEHDVTSEPGCYPESRRRLCKYPSVNPIAYVT